MAIPIAIAGALKTALKNAIKKSVKTLAKDAAKNGTKKVTQDIIKQTVKKTITDEQAILLNRLKSIPSKELYKYVSNDMGIPVDGIKEILKNFNQTDKMNNASKGKTFRDLAAQKLKSKLGLNKVKSIKDIYTKIKDYNDDKSDERDSRDFNHMVLREIRSLQNELDEKVKGVLGTFNKRQRKININTNITDLYNKELHYTEENLYFLDSIHDYIMDDLEFYSEGSGALDLGIVYDQDGGWNKYERDALTSFVKQVREMVGAALETTND